MPHAPCPTCGTENSAASRFCSQCGAVLVTHAVPAAANAADPGRRDTGETIPEGALKTVTVLFCDLVGSTRIVTGRSPEGAMKLYSSATDAMVRAVVEAGGTVIDRMGDGVMAVFGAPIAQPDHAHRACLAGSSISAEISKCMQDERAPGDAAPRVRVGLNSAEIAVAVIRDGKRTTCKLYGEGVNLAARVQAAAEPDSVYMTESTYARLKETCDATDVGVRKLKGFEKPVRLYKLVSLNPVSAESHISSALIGRVQELTALREMLDRLRSGRGGLCLISGEPGVGKTRLIEELEPLAIAQNMRWALGHSPPFSERLSYWPIIEVLRALLGFANGGNTAPDFEALQASLRQRVGAEADDMGLYFAALLSIAIPADAAERLPAPGSEAMAHQMLRSLFRFFKTLVRQRPLVLVLDDLQWADASSIAIVKHLCAIAGELPLLIIGVARPDAEGLQLARYMHELHAERYFEMPLEPLAGREAAALLETLMPLDESALGLNKLILERADGNPFFVEEIVRALKQADVVFSGDEGKWFCRVDVEQVQIPDSIKGTVLARIDRLNGDLRKTLCNASVIGREFLYRILDAITERGLELDRQLDQLRSLDLVADAHHHVPELEYMFKHAVVQEAVYESVFEERRQRTHLRVAECLEALFADDLAPHYGVLAFHFYRADRWDKAQEYLLRAADQAQRLAGDSEALVHLEQALEMVDKGTVGKLPALDRARIERKLGEIRFRRGDTERAIPHFRRALRLLNDHDPATRAGVRLRIAYEAARHLVLRACRAMLPTPGAKTVSDADTERGMVYEHLGWCNYHTDQERLLLSILRGANLGALRGDADALALSSAGIGYGFDLIGAFGLAHGYLRRALEFAKRASRSGVSALPLNVMGLHHWYTGDWEQALARYEEGVRCASEAGDSNNWMSIHAQQAWLLLLRGELVRSFEIGRLMTETGRESAMATGVHWGLLAQGRALFHGGRRLDGLALIREAIERARRMPDYQCIGQAQGTLALCLIQDGRLDDAAELVNRSLPMLRRRNLLGHDAIDIFMARAQLEVLRAERAPPEARARTLAVARRASRDALRRGRIVSWGRPAALRALARVEWLAGERPVAERLWAESRAAAQKLGARLELAATLLDCGTLSADRTALASGEAVREELWRTSRSLSDVQPLVPA